MISWIQRYFQHHFRTIFAVLLTVTIISFIFTIGAAPGIGRADRRVTERRVFGYNLASQDDQARLFGDARLSAQLQTGYPLDGAELENYALARAAALQLADKLHIPGSTPQEIADYIKTLRVFTGQDGQFDAQRYNQFRTSLKAGTQMSEASVSHVLGEDVRSSKVQKLLAGPGYVLPADVRMQLEQADTSWTLALAKVDYASFKPTVPVNDAILTKFFDENSFRYEIPPRVDVSVAEFSALALMPTIHVTDQEVRAFYDANPMRFPKPVNPKADLKNPPKPNPAADFAAVRTQVETTLRLERARTAATKAASDFSFALYERKLTPGTTAFENFLQTQKVTLKPLAPFTHEAGPAEFGGAREVADEAFKLAADRQYSDAVGVPAGAVVLFWRNLQPSRKPSLAEVHDKVAADYVDGEKRKRFVELGRTLRTGLEAKLKAGEPFDKAVAAVAAVNSVKIEAKAIPPFTRRQPPQDFDYTMEAPLDGLGKGSVSDMVVGKDLGSIVYVADKKVPPTDEKNPEFMTFYSRIAAGTANSTANEWMGDIVATELKRTDPSASAK